MAGAGNGPDRGKQKLIAEIKEGIGIIVASEGGKIDASLIRKKYEDYFGKRIAKGTKIASFVKEHMSDDFEVIQEGTHGSVAVIKSKTKRKNAKSVEIPVGKTTGKSKTKSDRVPMQPRSTINDNESDTFTEPNLRSAIHTATGSNMPASIHTETNMPTAPIRIDLGSSRSTNSIPFPLRPTLPMQPLLAYNTYQSHFPSLKAHHGQPTAVINHPSMQYLQPRQNPKTKVFQQVNYHVNSSTKALDKPNDTAVKNEVDRIIDELAKDHHVKVDLIQKRLFERFKVQSLKELGNYRKTEDIPGIRELLRKLREINASIQAFVMVRSVCTLHELDKYLASLYPGAQAYEDLKIGPLAKHPLVYEYFKFPSNLDPPEITTLKVMRYLKQFMSKNGWINKVDMPEFLEHLKEQMSCETLYELGVKIDSVGLIIKSIKGCCSAESATRRENEQRMLKEIGEEIEQQIPKIKKQLLGSNIHDPDSLVNRFLDLSPVDILKKLFEYCEKFFQGKAKTKVTKFVMLCNSDKPSRKLFQLALHKACRDLVKPVDDFRRENNAKNTANMVEETLQTGKHGDDYGGENPCPTQEELLHEVKRWLAGKSSKSVDLKLLARVEDSVLSHYKGFTTFRDLGQGSFLQLLSEHKELETLISISAHAEESALGVRKSDVIDLLQQCGVDSEKTKLYKAVRAQYSNLSTNLDETSLDGLVARARGQGSQQHGKTSVVYEACLVADTLDTIYVRGPDEDKQKEHVGALGYQDKDNALACLYQTPLLENIVAWSEWHRVFEPMFGNLKSFLRNNSSDHNPIKINDKVYPRDLVAIETSTGSLLRITRITSTDVFSRCAERGDVIGTSGHLVSLVFQYGGVKKAPLALLASHMKEAFLSLNAQSKASEESTKYVIRFAVKCLLRVPPLMRHALAMKIFIEPLKFVFGNGQTPGLVLKYCETFDEKSMVHSLGIHFGVSEWQQDFKKKLEFIESLDEEQEEVIDGIGEEIEVNKLENLNDQVEKESTDAQNESIVDEQMIDQDDISDHASSDESIECPEDDALMSTKEQECRAVVDSIRRDEFGIGIEFPPEHRQMMENQRSREGRGLHRLSSELYSKDTHFVLELVQNADDNRYSDNLSLPSITFFVNVEKIEVFNNEVGFEERNIRALCDVGKSTKGKQRYGYIGQKGIGFKSVFRITDTPEVHSNGYHIKFDAKSGPTGYILPHWCAAKTDEKAALDDWTTRIVLPLKEEMKDAQKRTLIARFHDVQPSLLLFLRRLRQIKIHDEVSNTTREMFRRDCGDKLIEITHSKGVDLWFVVKKELSASSMKEDIQSTEIALAFPLPSRSSESTISLNDVKAFIQAKSLIQQPVFAFLPLRSYGFRFIIQADFDVPSSREDVDKDSAWNQWLRQEIASLFVQAFDDFKIHDCFLGVASIIQLLQFIPLEDEVLDFFKPVTQTILEGISRKQCIPVLAKHSSNDTIFDMDTKSNHSETAGDSEVEIKWVFPSQVVVAEDYLIEELIRDQILNRYLNKYYLHPDLRADLHAPLRRVLGIETISCQHLIDIGKNIASEVKIKMETQQDAVTGFFEAFAQWVAKWLCSVYRCLERERDCSDETLHEIAQINIFPLSSGQCTPIFDRPVFLPLQDTIKGEQAKTKASRRAAEIVHREMASLHPLILESLDDIGKSQVRKLLERLQVKCLTSRDLIKHHIMPALQGTQNKSVSHPDAMFSYIVYIKDQWDLDQGVCNLQELRSCALIKTSKGFVNPSLEPVHFTVEYGNKTNLQMQFPSVPWTVVENSYIAIAKESRDSWEKFLSALGVVHFLAIERKDVSLNKSQLPSSVWSLLSEFWPQATGSYIIKDYGSSELDILLSAGSNDELKKLAEILDQHWDEMYSKYMDVPYLDEKGKVLGQTFSSFFLNLKEKPWLPTWSSKSSTKPLQCCPRDVFMPKPEVISLLGDHALYGTPSLVNEKFLKKLGIRTSVNFDTLVSELMKWVETSLGNEDGDFTTSLEHMTNVYHFLENQIKNNDERKKYLEDVTKNKPVIFVPSFCNNTSSPPNENTARKILGNFLPNKRVYWSDPSNLVQVYRKEALILTDPRKMLDRYYPTLKSFFVEFLRIDPSPNLKEYLNLLETISNQNSMASGPIVDDMMRVYDVISIKCLDQEESRRFVKGQLLNLKVFPTTEEKWVSLKEKPLFCDDKSLEKLFRDVESQKKDDEGSYVKACEEKVHFIKMGFQPKHRKGKRNEAFLNEEAKNSHIRKRVGKFFKEVCGIQNLSECVSLEIISTLASECPALQSFLFLWIPYIQRFVYYKHMDQHDKHQELGMPTALSTVKCFSAEELEVVYRLSTHPKITVSTKKTCGVENKTYLTFYVTDNDLKDTKNIIQELAQLFVRPVNVGNFSNFLHVLTQISEDDIENYMESQELDPLPDDVTEWMVPEPPPVQMSMTTDPSDETLTPLDSTISPEPERPTEMQETDSEPRGLQCWPPRAPGHGTPVVNGIRNKNPATEQILAAWPPPAPPDAYVSPKVEVVTAPALNDWQPQSQYDPRLISGPTALSNIAINPANQAEHDSNDQTTLPLVDESRSQPAVQVIQSQSNVSEFNSNVYSANETHNIPNTPARVSYDDVTRQPRYDVTRQLQYVRPLELSNVRVELEEVDLGTALGGTELISLAQSANAEEIGRWGEECVYIMLKNIEVNNQVIWVNESVESGRPYDIVIKGKDVEMFIEIKSTSTSEKNVLEISSQEIKCAFEKQENYHLYRVYNAGNPNDCRVARLCNLASNLDKKAVSLFILI